MSYLQFRSVGKTFPGVRALADISFSVGRGEVHGLLGENGAGKSTLLKILGGEYQPNEGEVLIDGKVQRFHSSRDAINAGIAIIHQELQYVPELTVWENLLLGHFPCRWGFVQRKEALEFVTEQLKRLGVDIDPALPLGALSIAQRQMVEICKGILRNAQVIALDEPTSSLSHQETEILFRLVRDLKAQGKSLIYISHRLEELYALCDTCTILRDGRKTASFPRLASVPRDELVRQMVGREINDIYHYQARTPGALRLQVTGVCGPGLKAPVALNVHAGEIVGMFGLVGAGRSELLRLIYGANRRTAGEVMLDSAPLAVAGVAASIAAGVMFCPEDRKEDGIIGCRSVSENINISCRRNHRLFGLFIDQKQESATADAFIQQLSIKTPGRSQPINLLSGGNQQKAILARWLAETELKVLMIDEPTRGIDVGAKHEIYQVLYELASHGVAIIMVSSELPEVLGVSDRVIVMREGAIAGELSRLDANEERVLQLALPQAA